MIRPGTAADLPALTEIYNGYVAHSHVTFDDVPFTAAEREAWFGHYSLTGPHRLLVVEEEGAVLGYATSSPFRPKPGYRTTVETSVYLAPGATGRGLGTALYDVLLPLVDAEGVHRALAGIALPNDGSVALHRRCGFTPVGTFTEVGWKGRWVDVAWYERQP
ncbi:MAG: N-acetyltransferase family protein [Mycobacteriales bacterium]